MKKKFHTAISHPLISGSIIVFMGTIVSNFSNFIFNIFMSRNLTVSDYGILASLNSLTLVFALIAESFVPTIVHFAGTFLAKKEHEKIRGIFFQANKIAVLFGGISFLFFALFAAQISEFFNIHSRFLVTLAGVIVFFAFLGSLNRGILQAKLLFKYLSFVNASASTLKLIVGISLVFLGYKLNGAVFGFFTSFFVSYVLVVIPLRHFFKEKSTFSIDLRKLFSYGMASAIALFSLTSFITSDILLVKHFFSPKEAGVYAGLSLIGRVIYFFSAPVVTVMFPLIVQKHTRAENYHNTFRLSLLFVFLSSGFLTILYFLFPQFIIKLFLKNAEYLAVSSSLGYFGIFMTLYIMLYVFTNFYLSIKRTKVYLPLIFSAVLQAVLIWFFHKTFFEVITISVFATTLPLALLVVYYFKSYEKADK